MLVSDYLKVVIFYNSFLIFSKKKSKSGRKILKHKSVVTTVLLEVGIVLGILKKVTLN